MGAADIGILINDSPSSPSTSSILGASAKRSNAYEWKSTTLSYNC